MAGAAPRVFGYTHDGENDVGWGCVHRSAQNVAAHTRAVVPVPSVRELCARIGRAWGSWSEPADYKAVFPAGATALFAGDERNLFRLTRKTQYVAEGSVADLHRRILDRTQRGFGFIIDDGTSGYAVVSRDYRPCFIDPHTSQPKAVPYTTQLASARGWMALEVPPAAETSAAAGPV